MASDKTIRIIDGSSNPVNTGTFALWESAGSFDGSAFVNGVFMANGWWKFVNIPDGVYKLRDTTNNVFIATFGADNGEWIGDTSLPYASLTANQTFTGNNTFSNVLIVANATAGTHAMNRDTSDGRYPQLAANNTMAGDNTHAGNDTFNNPVVLANATSDTHGMNRQTSDGRYPQLTANNTITGDNTITGNNTFTSNGTTTFALGSIPNVNAYPKISGTYIAPDNQNMFTPKRYVDDMVGQINVTPYQEAVTKRRVMFGGTDTTGQVYTTITPAVANLPTVSATNPGTIEIVRAGGSLGSLLTLQGGISVLPSTTAMANILFKGQGRTTGLIYTGSLTLSASTHFENLTLYFSNVETAGGRTITNATFRNCTIICYNTISFGNGVTLENCTVLTSGSSGITFTGTAKTYFVIVNNAVTDSRTTINLDGFVVVVGNSTAPPEPVSIPS